MCNDNLIKVLTFELEEDGLTPHIRGIEKGHTLEGMYKYINCRTVGVQVINVDGEKYDVWFDDEFLLNDTPKSPTVIANGSLIMGNILIARSDEMGETISIPNNHDKIVRLMDWFLESHLLAVKYFLDICKE